MTRDEALYKVKGYLTDIIPVENYSEVEEIIKALEQESCEDCISRQLAIDAVTRAIWHYPNECYKNLNVYEVVEALVGDAINSLPSADRLIGKWINREKCQVDEDAYEVAICSECGAEITIEYPYDSYCPNCGAKMLNMNYKNYRNRRVK